MKGADCGAMCRHVRERVASSAFCSKNEALLPTLQSLLVARLSPCHLRLGTS